ncbi:MAG: phosphoglycerate dehydrogenase [Verrucomicrobia bacterium]|nr:phosphoglycerate dehydrogenase [Verrucomicrobiota bacterium]
MNAPAKTDERFKILVCDRVSPKGVEALKRHPQFEVIVQEERLSESQMLPLMADLSAIIVRSQTKVTSRMIEAAPKLRAIGRAGVGVDNIDVEAATRRGIVVMNTPGGNTVSTAELTMGMMLALARKIPMAHASMKAGKWNRKQFQGAELKGKTLGILGVGRIGSEVAKRAQAFEMRVLGYDPYLTLARAKALQIDLVENVEELYRQADFITVHLPKSEETIGMINAEAMAKMKPGVRLINCARGGIIVEEDLLKAIRSGHVAGAALDVYQTEPPPPDSPLRSAPEIVMTPHLGASTAEAMESVGIEIAQNLADYLLSGVIRNAVNLPSLDAKTRERLGPYLKLGETLGVTLAQLAPKRTERLAITYGGASAELPQDAITRAVLKGFLQTAGGMDANFVNVRALAESLGLLVDEVRSSEEIDFHEWIHVKAEAGDRRATIAGTLFGARQLPRIVRLGDMPVEIVPEGTLMLLRNTDRPGMVGHIGGILGRHKVNIASMSLHRDRAGGNALTVLNLDNPPPEEAIRELSEDPDISKVRVVRLP